MSGSENVDPVVFSSTTKGFQKAGVVNLNMLPNTGTPAAYGLGFFCRNRPSIWPILLLLSM